MHSVQTVSSKCKETNEYTRHLQKTKWKRKRQNVSMSRCHKGRSEAGRRGEALNHSSLFFLSPTDETLHPESPKKTTLRENVHGMDLNGGHTVQTNGFVFNLSQKGRKYRLSSQCGRQSVTFRKRVHSGISRKFFCMNQLGPRKTSAS